MYKLAIAGTGYVGLVAGATFAEVGHHVTCVDVDEDKVEMMRAGISPIYEEGLESLMQRNVELGRLSYSTDFKAAYQDADAIFIGVGTPERADGSADLTHIASVARQIAESIEKDCLVIVKSTVPVGTNDKVEQFIRDFLVNDVHFEVASNPEFLAQGSAVHDTMYADRFIIGTESEWARNLLTDIYTSFHRPIVNVSRRSAEMIKYASNDFLALKISYINDIANLCELVGADIQDVAEGMSYDARIGDKFLNAGIGYGGSCFPKDTKALMSLARENGYELRTVQSAVEVNEQQKTKLFKEANKRLITFNGLKVAVLGLTFKPGTDDLREAASLVNVPLLLEQGADIYAFDPSGAVRFSTMYPEGRFGIGAITYASNVEQALLDAHVCFIFTEWDEVKLTTPERYAELMRTPLVYDGRNIYSVLEMEKAGVEYHSVGRFSTKFQGSKGAKQHGISIPLKK
ncbi:UDP-glucose dehydrogenase family protein [Sporosarcina aquimarina]|uniref:UDP-glucose 6-dehydrogenase n=1 Tax=Sporosarcina aquimarina TaxID=114975 RepID=A0ABU4G133_9BACL|nr:UDP-glucose/GDP-mannose dehydrogenase family protein [Sporosarcina aquimarina]MDW0110679.1 UDP-glucose/GDP-mannose dehydrogenase family protein [Sporosarcina aquimarina]